MKYSTSKVKDGVGLFGYEIILNNPVKRIIALFYSPNAQTNAQKVCDLLNEVSRSQGKHT